MNINTYVSISGAEVCLPRLFGSNSSVVEHPHWAFCLLDVHTWTVFLFNRYKNRIIMIIIIINSSSNILQLSWSNLILLHFLINSLI